jgi:hypothetical protein
MEIPFGEAAAPARIAVLYDQRARLWSPDVSPQSPATAAAAIPAAAAAIRDALTAAGWLPVLVDTTAWQLQSNLAAGGLLPPGQFHAIVIIFSVVQPRAFVAVNDLLGAVLHIPQLHCALAAVHVHMLPNATVAAAHIDASIPQLSCADVRRFVVAKSASLDRVRLARQMMAFVFGLSDETELQPQDSSAIPGVGGATMGHVDARSLSQLTEWLSRVTESTHASLRSPVRPAAIADSTGWNAAAAAWGDLTLIGQMREDQNANVPRWLAVQIPGAPPAPTTGSGSQWPALDGIGGAARELAIAASGGEDHRMLYVDRGTGATTWTMPEEFVLRSLEATVPAFASVRRGTADMSRAYLLTKAVATQQAVLEQEARNVAASQATSAAVRARSASRTFHRATTARGGKLQQLKNHCHGLREEARDLERTGLARRSEIAALEAEIAAVKDGVLQGEAADLAAVDKDIAAARQKLQTLETCRSEHERQKAELDQWAVERAALTTAYIAAWKANQATRQRVKMAIAETELVRDEHKRVAVERLEPLDCRIANLTARTERLEDECAELRGARTMQIREDIIKDKQLLDDTHMWHRLWPHAVRHVQGAPSAWRVCYIELRPAIAQLERSCDAYAMALRSLVQAGSREAGSFETRRKQACALQAEMRAEFTRFKATQDAMRWSNDVLVAQLVEADMKLAAVMSTEGLDRLVIEEAFAANHISAYLAFAEVVHSAAVVALRQAAQKLNTLR